MHIVNNNFAKWLKWQQDSTQDDNANYISDNIIWGWEGGWLGWGLVRANYVGEHILDATKLSCQTSRLFLGIFNLCGHSYFSRCVAFEEY